MDQLRARSMRPESLQWIGRSQRAIVAFFHAFYRVAQDALSIRWNWVRKWLGQSRGSNVVDSGHIAENESRPRVIYWNNIPAPYMVDRFNAIVRRGHLDLEVWFDARTEPDRTWTVDESTWQFPYRYLPRIGIGRYTLALPLTLARRRGPDLLISLYAAPSFLLGLRLAWWRGWITALWVEVTFDSWIRRRRWKDVLKSAVFRRVDGIVTPGRDGRAFAIQNGAREDRIHIARHVVDVEFFAREADKGRASRDEKRTELGVGGVVFIYVGRLWWVKGTKALMEAYTDLETRLPGRTSLLLVGDGPDADRIGRLVEERGLRVVQAGFHQRAELPLLYAAADAFVFPSLGDTYGLVVDEAMATGLPVISTTATGEIRERVIEGVNGLLVQPGDPLALATAMERIASNPRRRHEMGVRSAEMIAPYTIDHWAVVFETAVKDVIASRQAASR